MPKTVFQFLILILCAALVIRITWAMLAPDSLDQLPDQREYLMLGQNLLHHSSLCFFDPRFNQTIWAYRMPGYPIFLAACGGLLRNIRVVQSVVDVSTLCAVFLIARRLHISAAVALVSVGIIAINPFYIYLSGLILSETLFAALLAWTLWLIVSHRWLLAMLLNVTLCYVRPSGLLLTSLLILAADLNLSAQPAYAIRRRLLLILGFALFTVICLVPWACRNHNILGTNIWLTTNSGITLYDGFHTAASGGSNQQFISDFPQLSSINEVDRSRFLTRRAIEWAMHNLAKLPALSAIKILRGWSPIPLSREFGKTLYRSISAMYAIPFDLLCLMGLFSSRLKRSAKVLLITPAIYFTLVQVMSVGSIRYRMPAEAPLAVLAAAGVSDLVARTKISSKNAIATE